MTCCLRHLVIFIRCTFNPPANHQYWLPNRTSLHQIMFIIVNNPIFLSRPSSRAPKPLWLPVECACICPPPCTVAVRVGVMAIWLRLPGQWPVWWMTVGSTNIYWMWATPPLGTPSVTLPLVSHHLPPELLCVCPLPCGIINCPHYTYRR